MHDPVDAQGVPSSTGIPKLVVWTGIVGILLVFLVAGMVLATADANHMWPSENTLRLKLDAPPPQH